MNQARLAIYRFRRPLAAASAALAVLLLASALRPASGALTDVAVASSDLPPGSTLTAQDITLTPMPAAYLPPGAFTDPADAIGRTIAGGISAGEPITQSRLVAQGPRADGLHTVPVRLADAEAAALLVPGSVIDLVLASGDMGGAPGDTSGRVIAEGVQVVTVPQRETGAGFAATPRATGSLIVVATDRRTAVALAAAGAQPGLGVVLR